MILWDECEQKDHNMLPQEMEWDYARVLCAVVVIIVVAIALFRQG